MGGFSIWHFLVLVVPLGVLIVSALLPVLIRPSGPNRFGPPANPQSFPGAVSTGLRKYFAFQGRGSRSEYWWFYLATLLLWFAAGAVIVSVLSPEISSVLLLILPLAFIVPMLSSAVRRLHDINRSGWWLLLLLFGCGYITLIVLLAWPSQKDEVTAAF